MPPELSDRLTTGRRGRLIALVAFAIAATCIFVRLGELPLLQPDEGRNAQVAREMLVSHSWLIPTYDGLPYLDKPAFFFRAVALSFALFGESELAARIPSARLRSRGWLIHAVLPPRVRR
jgi:4-amino-4-deoxy-L-arabinose transferase-like glycosyltransferase